MNMQEQKAIIGRAERIDIVTLGLSKVPAKIDTGADASAIWVSSAYVEGTDLVCVFFGQGSPFYTGQPVRFPKGEYSLTRVSSSFGHKEVRYRVKLSIRIGGKRVSATFSLSNRDTRTYPVLIGRRLLHGKFLVDVSAGSPLVSQERAKKRKLKADLAELTEEGS